MTTVPIICIFWVFWKTAWYFMVIFRYNTIIHITSWWHVSLLAPLPLDLCYYQFISLCLENAGYIYLSLELHMHTTMLRNCVSLYLWRHIFEDISLRKEIQGLFSFKIKVYFFLNCTTFSEKFQQVRLEEIFAWFPSFCFIYLHYILYQLWKRISTLTYWFIK